MGVLGVIIASFVFQTGAAVQAFLLGRYLPGRWAWRAISFGLLMHGTRRVLVLISALLGGGPSPSLAQELGGFFGSLFLLVGVWKMRGYFEEQFRNQERLIQVEADQERVARQEAERAQMETEQRFQSLFGAMSEGVALHELVRDEAGQAKDYRILDVNPAYVRHTGIPETTARGSLGTMIYGTLEPPFLDIYERVARTGEPGSLEVFFPPLDRHFHISIFSPAPERFATVFEDITERKRAEEAIQASQGRLQLLLDSTAEAIYGIDLNGCCTFCNPACLQMLGYRHAEELLGRNMHDLIHHSHRDGSPADVHECRIYKAFTEGMGVHVEDEVFWRADGSRFPVEYWSYPQRSGGEVVGAVVGFLDRSEREQRETEIRRLSQFLESVIHHADVWMNVLDNQANVVLWNHAAEVISGYTQQEVLGNAHIWEWLYPDPAYRGLIGEKVSAILTKGEMVQGLETSILAKNGSTRILSWNSRSLLDASGSVTGSIAIGRDITETKLAEQEREKLLGELASKNRELETVVYVASHDLRSPLVNILGFSQRLEKAFGEALDALEQAPPDALRDRLEPILKERIPAALRFIQASGTKMDALINGLLRISRVGRAELKPENLDVQAMMEGILDSMAFQIQKAEAKVVIGALPPCRGDASQVNQIFSNLVDNALKYRDPDRSLQVELRGELQGDQVIYCVQDTGLGIRPEALEKIWGLFHRLDPNGGVSGEGLGLALVQRMVERNGGRAWADSEAGAGSRFFVALPAV